MSVRAALLAALLAGASSPAFSDANWFEAGDLVLRNDLLLLNDAEVIRLPVGQWPIPRAAVAYAIANAKEYPVTNSAVAHALERVRLALAAGESSRPLSAEYNLTAGEPSLLRQFGSSGRESGELSLRASYRGAGRAAAAIRLSAVADASDGRSWRLDGSHATVHAGNWLIGVQTLDRFWGPSHESSLILSNNARPIPTFAIERAEARPFSSRALSWLGPWRMHFGIGRMESERQDIDAPLFMAWRVVVMPFKEIELGFSRTAQFCGEQLECDLDTFANMLAGNDNVGFDATPENEPGNQMAGFDIRWASPIGSLPYAIYGQAIGEDESSYLPAKYLMQFGAEFWRPFADGALMQGFAEYTTTICSDTSGSGPYYNCAYGQGRFNAEGYRFHDRVIGHTTDRDSRSMAVGVTYTSGAGSLWSITLRSAELDRDGSEDPMIRLIEGPVDYRAMELAWRGKLFDGELRAELGLESLEPSGQDRSLEPFGFLRWQKSLFE